SLSVTDAVRALYSCSDVRLNISADQFRVCSGVDCCYGDRRNVAARVLANIDRLHRLQTGDENDETDHHRQHRPLDEKIGEGFHVDLWVTNPLALDSAAASARARCCSLPSFRCVV